MTEPPAKKSKKGNSIAQVESLTKISCKVPKDRLTSADGRGNKIAVLCPGDKSAPCRFFLATGASVFGYRSPISPQTSKIAGMEGTCMPGDTKEASLDAQGSLTLPTAVQSLTLAESETQGGTLLGAVDSFCTATLQRLNATGGYCGEAVRLPGSNSLTEGGWSGIVITSPADNALVATACQFSRLLSLYQGNQLVRSLGTLHRPHAITSFPPAASKILLAIAEGHQVSLWDDRVSGKGSCVSRLSTSTTSTLYCVAADVTGNLIATGGSDSTAYFFDVRRSSSPIDRWPSCVKYDLVSLHFPHSRSDFVFAGGVDQEVRCGLIDSKARKAAAKTLPNPHHSTRASTASSGVSFRGDNRWLGMARAFGCDLLAGYTAAQNVFLARFSFVDSH